jgi:flagellar basal body-associated protein FliL
MPSNTRVAGFGSQRSWNDEGNLEKGGEPSVSLLWIILIVVLVLLLLGFFSRGRW